jgi:(p)ppGpp synthase/HD superfamily hydrolase
MDLTWKAKLFAQDKHKNHLDDDGLPYFDSHISQVVSILKNVTNEGDILAAAWLHDTIEDTDTTYEELVEEFGNRIADLVMEVTHDGKKDHIGFYFPRLKSQKAILIKFADRLSNLSRMDGWPIERRQHYLKKSKFWKDKPIEPCQSGQK